MAAIVLRKLLLLVVVVVLLDVGSFWYATTLGPGGVTGVEDFAFLAPPEKPPPFWEAYRAHVGNLLRLDLGTFGNTPITTYLARALGKSAVLFGVAVLVTMVLGPLLGVLALQRRTNRIAPWAQVCLTIGSSVPGFFLGTLAIAAAILWARRFSPGNPPLPVQGYGIDSHLILPVLTLASRPILYVAHLTAGLIEDELQQDYVRVARSKGVPWRGLLWRHAVPNVAAAVVMVLAQSLRVLASTLILVEAVFDWRGVGWLVLNMIALDRANAGLFLQPDILAVIVVLFALVLLLADIAASIVAYRADPRLRRGADSMVAA